jgi:hypothetical protein
MGHFKLYAASKLNITNAIITKPLVLNLDE